MQDYLCNGMDVEHDLCVPSLFSVFLGLRFSTSIWNSPFNHFKVQYSLLLQYGILEELVTIFPARTGQQIYKIENAVAPSKL